jgi:ribose transport system ATP-binding protein
MSAPSDQLGSSATAVLETRSAPALRIDGLSKTFPGTRALDEVSLEIGAGEVQALVGHNGSGKSTLIKVLAGYHRPDAGAEAELFGRGFDLGHEVPEAIRFVHQDLGLVLELNTIENLALRAGFARGAGGRVRWREQRRHTNAVLERFAVEMDIEQPLADATPVERTVVAIAGALQDWPHEHGILVLDEPTALLPHDEVERLFAMVREVRRSGASVLYVSHRLDEIFDIADGVTVLRGGCVVGNSAVADLDERGLSRLMVGEDIDPAFRVDVPPRDDAEAVLELRDVRGRWLRGVDLTVRRGEILGVAGLAGAGVAELPMVIAGCAPDVVSGEMRMPQRSTAWTDVNHAARFGTALVPADRTRDAIFQEFSVGENISLSVLDGVRRGGRLSRRREARLVEEWMTQLGIVAAGPDALITTLSGGNQQKVVIARCLARDPDLLVLSEPTAGVDVGARIGIYRIVAQLAKAGIAVVVSSSDSGDIRAMCSRVVVLRDGVVATEFPGAGLTEHALVSATEGDRS